MLAMPLNEIYQTNLNLREENAGKVDSLLKEVTGKEAKSEVFDETRLTKIIHEDSEVMVLQGTGQGWAGVEKDAVAEQEEVESASPKRRSKAGRLISGGRCG